MIKKIELLHFRYELAGTSLLPAAFSVLLSPPAWWKAVIINTRTVGENKLIL
jgi:hypothetical protein